MASSRRAGSSRKASASDTTPGLAGVEPLQHALAVRYKDAAQTKVLGILRPLGEVRVVGAQRLALVQFADTDKCDQALAKLRPLLQKGDIDFMTPLLLDRTSQLHQVLTDEIAVRFKGKVSEKRLRALEKEFGVTVAARNEFVPNQYILRVPQPEGLRTLEVAKRLDASKDTEFATPNLVSEHAR
jgi:hypothetical protein